jgi:hypothetical protein
MYVPLVAVFLALLSSVTALSLNISSPYSKSSLSWTSCAGPEDTLKIESIQYFPDRELQFGLSN